MGISVQIYTRLPLKDPELRDFVVSCGGVWDDLRLRGTICKGDSYIWTVIDKWDLPNCLPEINKKIIEIIGGLPQSLLVVEIGKRNESQRLATEFCEKFCERWRAAAEDDCQNIFSRDDLTRMLAEGKVVCQEY